MIKDFFLTNIWLKISSLVFAIVLWFFVILSGRSEVTLEAPVNFKNLEPRLEIVDSPETVSITIEGQERLLRNIRQNGVRAVIDLSETKAGRSFFTLTKDNIQVPKTLLVKAIDPETISVMLEAQLKKSVTVKPDVVGLPEKGYSIVNISVLPEKVILEGPRSAVVRIFEIKTEPIDINGINADLKYKASLNLSDSNIKKNINKVEVDVTVKKNN